MNPKSFKKKSIENNLLSTEPIWRGLMGLDTTPLKIKKRGLRSRKSFLLKLTLMPKRKRFIGFFEKVSVNTIEYLKKEKGVISLNLGGLEDNMINCCHIALVLAAIILPIVIVLSGRTLKAEARVTKLEKKDGKEQKQINELKLEIEKLKGGKHD
jgi:hypothetical protein